MLDAYIQALLTVFEYLGWFFELHQVIKNKYEDKINLKLCIVFAED